jgi:hypothetical protein
MSDEQYTEIVDGKRQWKKTIYLAEKLDLYSSGVDYSHWFFLKVFKEELGLKEGGWTTYISTYATSYSDGLSVGDRVTVCPFDVSEYKWVVKRGAFEKTVLDMENIFEIIREAWATS